MGLRGRFSKQGEEALQRYLKKYRKPENVTALQVLNVDELLWRQLKGGVKSSDYSLQKMTSSQNLALIPTLRALESTKRGKASKNPKLRDGHFQDLMPFD